MRGEFPTGAGRWRAVLAAGLALAAAGCRPDVETGIPCASGGDLSCPTGWHCGEGGTCVAGEGPGTVELLAPAADGAVWGRVEVKARVRCATGVAGVSIVLATTGEVAGTAALAWKDESHTEVEATATLESWKVPDGAGTITVTLEPVQSALGRTAAVRQVTVANGVPVPVFEQPAADGEVAGLATVRVAVASKVPVDAVTVRRAGDSAWLASKSWQSADGMSGTATFEVDFGLTADGPATLEASAKDQAGRTGTTQQSVTVANGLPSVVIATPEEGAARRGTLAGTAQVTSKVKLERFEVKVGARAGSAEATWAGSDHLAATLALSASLAGLPDGTTELTVTAFDVAGRAGSATRAIYVDNTPVRITQSAATLTGPLLGGKLRVTVNKPLPAAPAVTAPGLTVGAAALSAGAWEWPLSHASATGDVTAHVTATDRLGEQASVDVTVPVDATAPATTGAVTWARNRSRADELSFQCTEAADYRITGPYGAPAQGRCDASGPLTVALGGNGPESPLPQLELTDAAKNKGTYAPTRRREEIQPEYTGDTAAYFSDAPGERLCPGQQYVDPSALKARDGATADVWPSTGCLGRPALGRVGRLRQTTTRPIVVEQGDGAARFALVDTAAGRDLLSLWSLHADGTGRTAGSWGPCDAWLRPAFDPRFQGWVCAQDGRMGQAFLPPDVLANPSFDDSASCEGRYVAVRQDPARVATLVVDVTGTTGVVWNTTSGPALVPPSTLRVQCDGKDTLLFASTMSSLTVWRMPAGATTWTAVTLQGTVPAPRVDFLTGPGGLFGGGRSAAGMTKDLWRFSGSAFVRVVPDGQGPARGGGALATSDGEVVALGGFLQNGRRPALAARATGAFAEAPAPLAVPVETGSSTWDFARNALYSACPGNSGPGLCEWTEDQGWRLLADVPAPAYNFPLVWVSSWNKPLLMGNQAFYAWDGNALQPLDQGWAYRAGTLSELSDGTLVLAPASGNASDGLMRYPWSGWMPLSMIYPTDRSLRHVPASGARALFAYSQTASQTTWLEGRAEQQQLYYEQRFGIWGSAALVPAGPNWVLAETAEGLALYTQWGGQQDSSWLRSLSASGPAWPSPDLGRILFGAGRTRTGGWASAGDGPMYELTERGRASVGAWAAAPGGVSSGTWNVTVCAATVHSVDNQREPAVVVHALDNGSGFAQRLEPAGTGNTCQPYGLDIAGGRGLQLRVAAQPYNAGDSAAVSVDELSVSFSWDLP